VCRRVAVALADDFGVEQSVIQQIDVSQNAVYLSVLEPSNSRRTAFPCASLVVKALASAPKY
jgi:hypothetical protein